MKRFVGSRTRPLKTQLFKKKKKGALPKSRLFGPKKVDFSLKKNLLQRAYFF
jgi:hypothetical protein